MREIETQRVRERQRGRDRQTDRQTEKETRHLPTLIGEIIFFWCFDLFLNHSHFMCFASYSFLLAGDFSCLLKTFANNVDPDQD